METCPLKLACMQCPQTKDLLERRRLDRLAEDQRMRQPWQAPPPPKKPILKAGAKQKKMPLVSPRDKRGPGVASGAAAGGAEDRQEVERQRKEWREGLRAHIDQQRAQKQEPLVWLDVGYIDMISYTIYR